jgi:predicted dehydrogenase
MRFGLAGFSHFHAHSMIQGMMERHDVEVVAVSEADDALFAQQASGYKLKRYRSAMEMAETEKLDAVGLVERPDERYKTAVELLARGVHVLIDKPAAVEEEALAKLIDAASAGSGKLFPYFTVRYERPVAKAIEFIESGKIGSISSFTSLRPHKLLKGIRPNWFWDMAGGVALDLGIHDIDFYRLICGLSPEEPVDAFGAAGNFKRAGTPSFSDSAQFMLRPLTGPSGTFLADWLTPSADPRHGDCAYFVAGTKGRIEIRSTGGIPGEGEALVLALEDEAPRIILDGPSSPSDIFEDFVKTAHGGQAGPGWIDLAAANGMAIVAAKACSGGKVERYLGTSRAWR